MNAATEHLIEAMKATKRGNGSKELDALGLVIKEAWHANESTCLDLPAILEALMEIVVGERCIAVPVWEVQALQSAYCTGYRHTEPKSRDEYDNATLAITNRLHEPKVDHVETLKAMLDHKRQHRLPPPNDEKQEIAALEAAIKRMEQP